MAVIGFIFCFLFMLLVSFVSAIIVWQYSGQWTIGGARNSWRKRVLSIWILFGVALAWIALFKIAPFTILIE